MQNIAVIGAGSWGTALARLLASSGNSVRIWSYESSVATDISDNHTNSRYLPGVTLPDSIRASTDIAWVMELATTIVLVTPSQTMRDVTSQIAPLLDTQSRLVCCSKGIEISTGNLMSEIMGETIPQHPSNHITYLSGPSFAREVAEEQPTAVVVAGPDPKITQEIQMLFRTSYFMVFAHDDIIGVEVGGAVKNVLALAAGIVEGLGLGHNTRAALITRGLYEMIKIGVALGASPLTFSGLAGIGDLTLTCTGNLSRNLQVGISLGQGIPMANIRQKMNMVAEGIDTSQAIYNLTDKLGLKTPICDAVYQIVHHEKSPLEALEELTSMELGSELRLIK